MRESEENLVIQNPETISNYRITTGFHTIKHKLTIDTDRPDEGTEY